MADGKVVFEIEAETGNFEKAVENLGSDAERAVGKGLSSASDAAGKASDSISSRLKSVFSGLGSKVSGVLSSISTRFPVLGTVASKVFSGIKAVAGRAFEGVRDVAGKAFSAAASAARNALSGLASAAATVAKVVGGAIVGGLALIGKQSFEAYGNLEQLRGGAELMFGEGYDYIAEHAAAAYRTVQMSQNDYLTQVNGFAVGLREALGGDEQAAAVLADRIVTAEADIVSATGNSADAVQAAFNGVMKNNFSMLDNLGLGINATKEGMQEVIDKMNEVNGTDYSIDNLADIQNALIDYVEYCGMAGYAASEGATTIQGSVSSMKAAWENFLAGLADPQADIGQLASNLTGTVVNAAGTIVPAFVRAISGAVTELPGALAELAPVLAEGVSRAVAEAMGMDLHEGESATQLATRIVKVLCNELVQGASGVMESASEMLEGVTDAVTELAPVVVGSVGVLLAKLTARLADDAPRMLEGAATLFSTIAEAISAKGPEILANVAELAGSLIQSVTDGVPGMLDGAGQLIGGILDAIAELAPDIVSRLVELLTTLIQELPLRIPDMLSAAVEFVGSILSAILQQMPAIVAGLATTVGELIGLVVGSVGEMLNAGVELITGLFRGTEDGSSPLKDWFRNLPQTLLGCLGDVLGFFANVGVNIVQGIINGISSIGGQISSTLSGYVQGAFDTVCGWLGIASPSRLFRDRVGRMITLGVAEGIESERGALDRALEGTLDIERNSLARLAMTPMPAISAAGYAGASLPAVAAAASAGLGAASQQAWAPGLAARLDSILAAVERGQTIELNDRELGRTVRRYV